MVDIKLINNSDDELYKMIDKNLINLPKRIK